MMTVVLLVACSSNLFHLLLVTSVTQLPALHVNLSISPPSNLACGALMMARSISPPSILACRASIMALSISPPYILARGALIMALSPRRQLG